jgi:hypothetical protein
LTPPPPNFLFKITQASAHTAQRMDLHGSFKNSI